MQSFFLVCLLLSYGLTHVAAQDVIYLKSIPPVQPPVITNKTIRFNIDLVFNDCSQEYWVYYAAKQQQLVIEFIGVHIEASPVEIRGTSIASGVVVENGSTNFALSGKRARITMALREGWHYESWVISGKVLRLQLWAEVRPKEFLRKNGGRVIVPTILTLLGLSLVAFSVIFFTGR